VLILLTRVNFCIPYRSYLKSKRSNRGNLIHLKRVLRFAQNDNFKQLYIKKSLDLDENYSGNLVRL